MQCEICKKEFTKLSEFKRHKQRKTICRPQQWQCECGKKFVSNRSRWEHKRNYCVLKKLTKNKQPKAEQNKEQPSTEQTKHKEQITTLTEEMLTQQLKREAENREDRAKEIANQIIKQLQNDKANLQLKLSEALKRAEKAETELQKEQNKNFELRSELADVQTARLILEEERKAKTTKVKTPSCVATKRKLISRYESESSDDD